MRNESSCVCFISNLVSIMFGHGRVCSSHFSEQGEGDQHTLYEKFPGTEGNAWHMLFSPGIDCQFQAMPCRCHHCYFSQGKVPASQPVG